MIGKSHDILHDEVVDPCIQLAQIEYISHAYVPILVQVKQLKYKLELFSLRSLQKVFIDFVEIHLKSKLFA